MKINLSISKQSSVKTFSGCTQGAESQCGVMYRFGFI